MQPSRDISRLIEIMAALRDPNTGCPWDLEQDFASIRHHTVEEAYEVADAIEREDFDDLRDELGDLLLQPVYLAQLAKEQGHFNMGDVIQSITEKLIRRHPHVFGDTAAKNARAAKGSWEKVKAEERAQKADKAKKAEPSSLLDDVPRPLPALNRAEKLAKRAASVGFDWPTTDLVVAKLREELSEVEEAVSQNQGQAAVHEEIGDLLFAITNLARHLDVDAEAALADANTKFTRRFKYVEQRCAQDDLSLKDAGLERLDAYWNEIRKRDKSDI
jgi:ATP diphosphatase